MRPINVVASIAPLLGLLGTVQGMIMAFMVTSTTSSTGTAKAQELAHGIYTALVTTFAGLSVAVFSVVLANFLEGRIERLLRQMEAIFLDLLPQLERYEGRIRIAESTAAEEPGIRVKTVQHNGLPPSEKSETPQPRQPVETNDAQRQEAPAKSNDIGQQSVRTSGALTEVMWRRSPQKRFRRQQGQPRPLPGTGLEDRFTASQL